jgi:signal transduction histidine kinase
MGLITAIRSICREFQGVYKEIHIETEITVQEDEIQESLKIVIYRILQEALNNVFKHSEADTVHVKLGKTDSALELSIKDNGRGFDWDENPASGGQVGGMGLLGMKERIELSNGLFEKISEKGKGSVIKGSWPLT